MHACMQASKHAGKQASKQASKALNKANKHRDLELELKIYLDTWRLHCSDWILIFEELMQLEFWLEQLMLHLTYSLIFEIWISHHIGLFL